MDIVTHAVVGAVTGAAFGHPMVGAVVAVLPDAVLGVTRRSAPSAAYNATHSLLVVVAAALVALALVPDPCPAVIFWCLVSHLFLDVMTHGERWAPPLLHPIRHTRFSWGDEWEFFNRSWWRGLACAFAWSFAWIGIASFL